MKFGGSQTHLIMLAAESTNWISICGFRLPPHLWEMTYRVSAVWVGLKHGATKLQCFYHHFPDEIAILRHSPRTNPVSPSWWLPLLCRFNLYVWWLNCPSNSPAVQRTARPSLPTAFSSRPWAPRFCAGKKAEPRLVLDQGRGAWAKSFRPVSDIGPAETVLGPFRDSFSSFLMFWALVAVQRRVLASPKRTGSTNSFNEHVDLWVTPSEVFRYYYCFYSKL